MLFRKRDHLRGWSEVAEFPVMLLPFREGIDQAARIAQVENDPLIVQVEDRRALRCRGLFHADFLSQTQR